MAADFYALDELRVCDLPEHAYLGRHSHPARPVDVGYVVSVNEVPAHLVDLVKAHLSMHLDAIMSDLFDDIEDVTIKPDVPDDDLDVLANLATNVEPVR